MPMIRLYVFLLDFLIPFLCDPDLQCGREVFMGMFGTRFDAMGMSQICWILYQDCFKQKGHFWVGSL